MLNKKIKKILTISMACSMLFCNNAFATPIDLTNSEMDVKTDTLDKSIGTDYFTDEENEWLDGTIDEEVRVTVDIESLFDIIIPKDVVLDGNIKKADYQVTVKGDIAGDQKITVTPDETFDMKEKGGKDAIIATVTQNDKEFVYNEINESGKTVDGLIEANDLTAGEWSGKFAFNINFGEAILPTKGDILEAYSWDEIAAISEAGLAEEYFNVGDEKTITLNTTSTTNMNTLADTGETYTLQIIGFNHDDLADGSGKAGITFQFKELMNTLHNMSDSDSNIGGWENSDMRIYINNDVYNSLPNNLQNKIKIVNKKTSIGNRSTETINSQDKLFLLSEIEVLGNCIYSSPNEGEQYKYYFNNSEIKYTLSNTQDYWWLRSPYIINSIDYCIIYKNGGSVRGDTNINSYVSPAFCI